MDINNFILSLSSTRLVTGSCMCVLGSYALRTLVIIVLCVDYMGLAAQQMKMASMIKNDFIAKCGMKHLDEPKMILGMQFNDSHNGMFLEIPENISMIYLKCVHMLTIRGGYQSPVAVSTFLYKTM